jgi:hypothetical protein
MRRMFQMTLTPEQLKEVLSKPGMASANPASAPKIEQATQPSTPSKADILSERKLQDLINNWLLRNGFYFIRQRMDRKSTLTIGAPDFHVCNKNDNGRMIGLEVKVGNNHPTEEQNREMDRLRNSQGKAFTVRSLEEVIRILA